MQLKNKTSDLKKIYDEIEIPNELDKVIDEAFRKGRNEIMYSQNVKNKKRNNGLKKAMVGIAAGFIIFTTGVNTVPSFADSMGNIPILGNLVQILQINKGIGQGGQITDGADVKFITLKEIKNGEQIIIDFSAGEEKMENAPHFEVSYNENPYTMTFTISGARSLTAEKDFKEIVNSKYVEDVYKLITLDDSAVRFNIVFNQPVDFTVEEYEAPGQIVINLSEDGTKGNVSPIYSVRTNSYSFGEEFGQLEEMFYGFEDVRVLKDKEGSFLIEIGQFSSKEEAEVELKEVIDKVGDSIKLHVEEREAVAIPRTITE